MTATSSEGARHSEPSDYLMIRLDERSRAIQDELKEIRSQMVTKVELQATQASVKTDVAKVQGDIKPLKMFYYAVVGTIITALVGGGIAALFAQSRGR